MIRTAPEGRKYLIRVWSIAAALAVLAISYHTWGWWLGFGLWLALSLWVVAFFRDPVRLGPRGPQLLIAPADGKVVSITEINEPAFFRDRVRRISIFMNAFNCHVNRYPADGTVTYRHYNPGKFGHAAAEKSSLDNEQSSVGLTTPGGRVLVRQIAGLLARRIVTDHAVGAGVKQGDRLGIIRFGSRVDIFVPLDTRVAVKTGDTTRAGATVIAEWP